MQMMSWKKFSINYPIRTFLPVFFGAESSCSREALQEISRIVASINHFPSDADKNALRISLAMTICLKE